MTTEEHGWDPALLSTPHLLQGLPIPTLLPLSPHTSDLHIGWNTPPPKKTGCWLATTLKNPQMILECSFLALRYTEIKANLEENPFLFQKRAINYKKQSMPHYNYGAAIKFTHHPFHTMYNTHAKMRNIYKCSNYYTAWLSTLHIAYFHVSKSSQDWPVIHNQEICYLTNMW